MRCFLRNPNKLDVLEAARAFFFRPVGEPVVSGTFFRECFPGVMYVLGSESASKATLLSTGPCFGRAQRVNTRCNWCCNGRIEVLDLGFTLVRLVLEVGCLFSN